MPENDVERKALLAERFKQIYGQEPKFWSCAPGRVDLMGSHTDYNQGYVLTLAIGNDTWIAANPRVDGQVFVCSLDLEGTSQFLLDEISPDTNVRWTNYVRGVASVLQNDGYRLTGFNGLIQSTIPLGSGLSSSAALEVATARLFKDLGKLDISPIQIAKLCQKAENEFVGMNCGILDQFTSSVGEAGSAVLLDCRDLSSHPVYLDAGVVVMICDTHARRELTGSEYPERRAQCEEGAKQLAKSNPGVLTLRDATLDMLMNNRESLDSVTERRCRFIIEEDQRVLQLATALPVGDKSAIQQLTSASYSGARDLYEIVSVEMERMMEAMLGAPGIIGARQAGAGFGGCMVAFVEQGEIVSFSEHVQQSYGSATGIKPHVYRVS